MESPLFSVVIPTFNRAALLREALRSLAAQEFKRFEVIVVDGGSTDDTEAVVRNCGMPVRWLQQPRPAPGMARNFGCREALGQYLTFLDSDDLWFPWTLASFTEIIEREGKPSWIMGRELEFEQPDAARAVTRETLNYSTFSDYLSSSDFAAWVPGCCMAIRRDAFARVGGFTDKRISGEDSDLALRLGAETGFVHITKPYTVAYRQHANNTIKMFDRSLAGVRHQIRAELAGVYPGGEERRRARWQILTRHIRPVSVACLSCGLRREGWELYRASFNWHLAVGRWKYLAGFPLQALVS